MKDISLAGSVAGIATIMIKEVVEFALGVAELVPVGTQYRYVTAMIFPPDLVIPGLMKMIIVTFIHLTVAAFYGTLLAYIGIHTGLRFYLLKGAGYGGLIFINFATICPKLIEPRLLPVLSQPGAFAWMFVAHVGWGVLSAYLLSKTLAERVVDRTALT